MNKWWLYRNYLWVGVLVGLAVAGLMYFLTLPHAATVAGIGAVLTFYYFVQRQRLDETELFRKLFMEFNKTYDGLNDALARIAADPALLDQHEYRSKLIDYFNLCAEEYLFYLKGYIYPEVWTAWCRGMLQYLRVKAIRELWDSEARTESYYGMTSETIENGAH